MKDKRDQLMKGFLELARENKSASVKRWKQALAQCVRELLGGQRGDEPGSAGRGA